VQISFGAFLLDRDTRQLLRGKRPIHLEPKAFDLLLTLVTERPKVLSKTALQQHLWPETFVAESNLSNLVGEIRAALGDRPRAPRFIRTAHGFGYAFCGNATAVPGPPGKPAGHPRCWLAWGKRRLPLSIGENILGRDADIEVQLDASTVSRRHARLLITAESAVIEDLGSKNGTFIDDRRVTRSVPLANGDAIRIGSLLVTFHRPTISASTETHASTK